MPKQLSAQLSTHTVHLGSGRDRFEVTVNNLSDRFATFALELSASGLDRHAPPDWYRLTPDISAKIPAGDHINFVVNILEVPPIVGGFAGKMNLNVNVTCLELGEEDRQLVNLIVAGSGILPPVLSMPTTDFQTTPGDLVEIPLQIHNPNRNTANLRVVLKGLANAWLTDGHERRLQVSPEGEARALFVCQPPLSSEAQRYPFTLEVSQAKAAAVRQTGSLEILPTGWIELSLEPLAAEPSAAEDGSAGYCLELNNRSNISQSVALTLRRTDVPWHQRLLAVLRRRPPKPLLTTVHLLHLSPAEVNLKAGDRAQISLTTRPKLPLLGWRRRQQFQLKPQNQLVEVRPYACQIELVAPPKIPFWLQCFGLGCLSIGAIALSYWQPGHRGPVNSVQFDGQANALVSAADDQTIHRWQVSDRLHNVAALRDIDKAIRVVRYRPRNNNLLAVGLENGEIQLWDFLSARSPIGLVSQPDDRVFDLQFARDSNSLFSAHGSGSILRWDIDELTASDQRTAAQARQFEFAAQAIALVGPQQDVLAIGGRFNQLMLWNFEQDWQQAIAYPEPDNPNHYISSLDAAEDKPTRLATADNQGRISLWNLRDCLPDDLSAGLSAKNCPPTDRWTDGHQKKSVNAIALTKDACYLVSGGDDGRVMLWSLNPQGQVMQRQRIARFRQPINSVDIVQQGQTLLIGSGGDSGRVKLHHTRAQNPACP